MQEISIAGASAGAAYQLSIDICCRRPRSAENAGSVMLRTDGRGSTKSCILCCVKQDYEFLMMYETTADFTVHSLLTVRS